LPVMADNRGWRRIGDCRHDMAGSH
jgi:hypothetical protein